MEKVMVYTSNLEMDFNETFININLYRLVSCFPIVIVSENAHEAKEKLSNKE